MENEKKEPTLAPQQPHIPETNIAAPVISKQTSPWVWIISGCLIIIVLVIGTFIFLGWWGYHKAKNEINKHQPKFEQLQKDLEEASKDAEEFNKKAQEIQNSIPNPEDITYPAPSLEEEPVLN